MPDPHRFVFSVTLTQNQWDLVTEGLETLRNEYDEEEATPIINAVMKAERQALDG